MTREINGQSVATSPTVESHCDLCGVMAACLSILEDEMDCRERHELSVLIVKEDLLCVILDGLALNCRTEVLEASERRSHRSLRFIIDSGASSHMFPCKSLFRDIACTVQGKVSLGKSEYKLRIVGQGTTAISSLDEVLWVPGLSFGLISISRFAAKGYKAVFEADKVTVFDEVGEVVLSGSMEHSLYYVDKVYLEELWGSSVCTCSEQQVTAVVDQDVDEEILSPGVQSQLHEERIVANAKSSEEPLEILHKRFGHASEGVIRRALQNKNFADCEFSYEDVKDSKLKFCPSCFEGKMKAFSSPDTDRRNELQLFEKMAIDYKGKFRTPSVHGHTGFYLVSDYASRYVFAFPCKSKGEETLMPILEEYKSFAAQAERKIKILQCDFDSVLLSNKVGGWLKDNGIRLQTSAPYVHWQNGFIESSIGKVMDKARAMMASGCVPRCYWNYAVLCACYLANRLPVRKSDKTPYEIRFGSPPAISHLVPFWCPGVFHKTAAERQGSLDFKAERCRMLGYDERMKNSYFVLVMRTGAILSRHDCKWDEESMTSLSADPQCPEIEEGAEYEEEDFEESLEDLQSELFESPRAEVVPDNEYDDDEPYWKSADVLIAESANLLERWVEDVRGLAVAFALAGVNLFLPPLPPAPKTIEEALEGPDQDKWSEALIKELTGFDDRGTFAPAPQKGRAMKTKFVLSTLYKNDYSQKFKVRMVACGYSQIFGLDYQDTYAPTASTSAVMVVIQLGAMRCLKFSEFDVTAAFLEGKNDFPNFARLPKYLGGVRVEVVGNFYGEKQGPKIWYEQLHGILTRAGFERCPVHPCIYRKVRDDGQYMWVVVHVDDGLVVTSDIETREEFLKYFKTQVRETTHLEVVGRYVGMDFDFFPEERRVLLSHKLYISQRYGEFSEGETIPMHPSVNLRTAKPNPDNSSMLHDTGEFRFICDRARPDMLVVTGELATGGDKSPSNDHKKVAERAKHYLKSTQNIGLSLGGLGKLCVFGYSDASLVTDGNCKSRLGGCVFLNADSGSVRSFSKNDTQPSSLSHSSCEAEIKAMDEWVREVLHLMDIYRFLCGPYDDPVMLFVDSKSAIDLCESLKQSHKVKHINLRIHFIRELIEDGFLELFFVPGVDNVADMLTKPLAKDVFEKHRKILLSGHDGVMPKRDELVNLVCVDAAIAFAWYEEMCVVTSVDQLFN